MAPELFTAIAGIHRLEKRRLVNGLARSCAVGDVVTFIGRSGDASITVQDVADAGGLSPYEILTGLRGRLPRQYAGGQ